MYPYPNSNPYVADTEYQASGWSDADYRYQVSGLSDISVGPHLISPIGMGYAWGQGLGLWGQKEDEGKRRGRDRERSSFDWSGVAKVGAVVGIGVVAYFFYRSIRSGVKNSATAIRSGFETVRGGGE